MCLNLKDKSRIVRNLRDLWGTIATGLIFNLFGMSFFMSFHLTTLAYPLFIFASVSSRNAMMASLLRADLWAPRWSAAVMCSTLQSGPQSTGQPCLPHLSIVGAAG